MVSPEVLATAVPLVAQAAEVLANAVRADRLAIFRAEQEALDSDPEQGCPGSGDTEARFSPFSPVPSFASADGFEGEGAGSGTEGGKEESNRGGEGAEKGRASAEK